MTNFSSDAQAKRNVAVLIFAQAILGSQMPIIFILAGLAGQSLAENICYATLPISVIIIGSIPGAPMISSIMQRYGRKVGFFIGAGAGAIGAIIGSFGLYYDSFALFLLGSLFTGIYMSAQGFYRFAATDTASDTFRPKAISYVLAGGLLAAIIGPQLAKITSDAFVIPFLGAYMAVIALNVFGAFVFVFLDLPKPARDATASSGGRSFVELLRSPKIATAMLAAMICYSMMTLVMTATPLAIVGCGYSQNTAADVVSAHVLAMFMPSFFTGHLIVRFGVERIILCGIALLGAACIAGLNGITIGNFYSALVLLGLGWNFGFIGATTLLTSAHSPEERGRAQGMNDFFVAASITIASFASGGLMNCSGNSTAEGWNAVILTMIPLLAVAAMAILWQMRQSAAQPTSGR